MVFNASPFRSCFGLALVVLGTAWGTHGSAKESAWPAFRGDGRSAAADSQLPARWSVENNENIAWKASLPGRGVSGPIVVNGKVFVTCASGPRRDRLHVLAFDVQTGETLWHRQFWAVGRTLVHPVSSVAANTPASDGERIFAFFSSNDLFALDLDGNLLWMRALTIDHPQAGNDVGMSSSPAVAGNVVVVQSEAQADGFVEALDVATGETRWKDARPHSPNWCSPVAWRQNWQGSTLDVVLLQSAEGVEARRADTGKTLWSLPLPCSTIPSPVYDGKIFIPAEGLRAVEVDATKGEPSVVWHASAMQPGNPSPVVHDARIYVINGAGVLNCGDLSSEQALWKLRLGGKFWATPVAAGKRMVCINEAGTAYVVDLPSPNDADGKGVVAATIELGEEVLASPAVADNALYVRSHQRLWKIAE